MKRSGNHIIIDWILSNLLNTLDEKIYIDNEKVSFTSNSLAFINNCTFSCQRKLIKAIARPKPKILIISYEDLPPFNIIPNAIPIIIIRNLENLVSSRIKSNANSLNIRKPIDELFFKTWETHAKSDFKKIHYDKWLIDEVYRKELLFNLFSSSKIIDIPTHVPKCGGGSSFTGENLDSIANLLSRYKLVNIDSSTINMMNYYGSRNLNFYNYNI